MNLTDQPQPRLDYAAAAPEEVRAVFALEKHSRASGLEKSLLELVRLRASQINGCAYCVDLHTRDMRAAGEDERRLQTVVVWREVALFTPRERAALAWTEAVTLIASSHVPDEVYEEARKHFSEKELVDLTLAIVTINGWNRISIATRAQPHVKSAKAA